MTLFKGCIMYQNRVLIPEALHTIVLNQIHDGHPGIVAMKSIARSLLWFRGIDKKLEELVKKL